MFNELVVSLVIPVVLSNGAKLVETFSDLDSGTLSAYTCHVNGSIYNNDYAQQKATKMIADDEDLASLDIDADDIVVSKEFKKKKNKKLEEFKKIEKEYNYAVLDSDMVPGNYDAKPKNVVKEKSNDASDVEGVSEKDSGYTQPTNSDESAKLIYSIFKEFGINDNVTAAVLGFWHYESELDPTCVEGDYLLPNSRFSMNADKQAILNDLDYWCRNTLFPRRSSGSYSAKGYLFDGKYLCGGGVPAYTAGHMYDLQVNAKTFGTTWYDLAYQMAFEFAVYGNSYFKDINSKSSSNSIDSACVHFLGYHQYRDGRTSCRKLNERIQKAYEYKAKFAEWSINKEFNARVKNFMHNNWKKHSWENPAVFSMIKGSIPNVG